MEKRLGSGVCGEETMAMKKSVSVSKKMQRNRRLRNFTQLVTLSTLTILFASLPHQCQGSERLTKYGCEGTTLKIECQKGTAINLVRANYGRFSISICNAAGITDWSVNCMEPRTLRVINARCEGKPSCHIPVDSKIFGDPCPGTNKYVEVHYTCQAIRKAQTTTAKALPPWLLDLAATPSSIVVTEAEEISSSTTTTTTTTTTTASTTTTVSETSTSQSNAIGDIIVEKHVVSVDESENDIDDVENYADEDDYENDSEVDDYDDQLRILSEIVEHCPPQTSRDLFWNWTRTGDVAIKICPQGSTGFARWACGSDGAWSSEHPNLSECQSTWLTRMEQSLQSNSAPLNTIAMELAASSETKTLYGGDFTVAAKIMQALAHRLSQELYVMASQEDKETLVAELMQSIMKTTSNLLDKQHSVAWLDLDERKRSIAATALMLAIEENALLLAETINSEKHLFEATNNVLASIRIMRARGVPDQTFPQLESVLASEESQVTIPSETLIARSVNGACRLVFFLYNNFEIILPQPKSSLGNKFINSKVMGAVYSKSRYLDVYKRPIQVTLRHIETTAARNPTCATWNYTAKQWATDTCSVVKTNATHTTCQCLKLANYAVLMEKIPNAEPHEGGTAAANDDASFTTMIICVAVLAVCILVAVIGLIVIKRWDVKPTTSLHKLFSGGNRKLPCFHCKKSESQNSCSSTGGLYPALTSSPTSTTVSGSGTPMNNSSNYLVQILEQQQETLKHIKDNQGNSQGGTMYMPQKAVPQHHAKGSIYQVTAPRGTMLRQLNESDAVKLSGVFRPVSPYNHHIYMEIDPVYSQTADQNNELNYQSDIQLSDISDDDLRRFSDSSSRATQYGEERPLIRASLQQQQQQMNNNNLMRQSLIAAQAQQLQRNCMTTNRMRSIGPLQVATLNNQSLRGLNRLRQHQTIYTPNPIHSANPSIVSANSGLEGPVAIALQNGEQFVSLQIDQQHPQQQGHIQQHPQQ